MIPIHLDRSSPTPLYHQIVQAIRWRVGTAELGPGELLPPIRESAEHWNVNYHTVRRAYHELAALGLVESFRGSGTRIAAPLPDEAGTGQEDLDRWLREIRAISESRYGISAEELAVRLRERSPVRVVMVECNQHQSTFLARQIEQAWSTEAIPWALEGSGEPPRLPIIGTYFHHAEMRSRWPERVLDMHFVALHLDPDLKGRIEGVAAMRGSQRLRLVEEDLTTAQEMAKDVSALLSRRFEIEPAVGDPDELARSLAEDELLLVAPRLWDRLEAITRADERVFDVRHLIVPTDLRRVRQRLKAVAVEDGSDDRNPE